MTVLSRASHAEVLTVADEITARLAADLTLTYEDIARHNRAVGWRVGIPHEPIALSDADLARAWALGASERAAMGYSI